MTPDLSLPWMGRDTQGLEMEKAARETRGGHICTEGPRDRKGVEPQSLAALPKAKGV